jgi:hypothetical protein
VTAIDFLVSRADLKQSRFARSPAGIDLQPGQALLQIDRFGFSANNITYAVFGDTMQYWNFFPGPPGWGRVPVWGFAEVMASRCDGLAEGERVFGYLPISTHVIMQPQRLTPRSFADGMEHRRALPAAYQHYARMRGASMDAGQEDLLALLRPLFFLSFLVDDFLAQKEFFGARSVVLSSASSKTALAMAYLLKQRGTCAVIGLTSPQNAAFCRGAGCYDRIVEYGQLGSLPQDTPTVFVDMAGNGALLHDIHHHFAERLKYSCMIGGTHWDKRSTQHGLPGAKPTFFFAPTQYQELARKIGPAGVEARMDAAWHAFAPFAHSWLRTTSRSGEAAVQSVYLETLEGRAPPELGYILSLKDAA